MKTFETTYEGKSLTVVAEPQHLECGCFNGYRAVAIEADGSRHLLPVYDNDPMLCVDFGVFIVKQVENAARD